jgi:hypothetical protein
VGEIREEMLALSSFRGGRGVGIARRDYLNTEVRLAVEEGDTVDLLAMGTAGRPRLLLFGQPPAASRSWTIWHKATISS